MKVFHRRSNVLRSGAPARIVIALFCLLLALPAQAAVAPDRLKLAVGQRGNWDTSVAEVGKRAGIFRKHGLELEILYTDGGGETLQAVLARGVDIGVGLGVMGTLGAFSKGAPVRVIGAEVTGAGDLFWYVRANSPIRSMRDVAGKTVAYSTTGSSTNGVVLALAEQFKVAARPTATGGPAATLTQVMSGQIDVGWSAPPFGLEQLDRRQIRIIAGGNDANVFKGQTVRLLAIHAQTLQTRADAVRRFMRGYRETLNWMFTDPRALTIFAEFSGVSEATAKRTKEFFTKQAMDPDRIVGLDQIMDDGVRMKYMTAPLTRAQLTQLIQIPAP